MHYEEQATLYRFQVGRFYLYWYKRPYTKCLDNFRFISENDSVVGRFVYIATPWFEFYL